MSTFEHAEEVVHETDHVPRRREQLQVIGSERPLGVCAHERSARVLPRPACMGRTPSLQGVDGSHRRERYS